MPANSSRSFPPVSAILILTCLFAVDALALVRPLPTHGNLRYGPYKRNVLDLWVPESDEPVPLVIYFHGGGFKQGGKGLIRPGEVKKALDNGVAIASVQYRFVHRNGRNDPQRTGIHNSLRDSARALQFLRHNAERYGIDKERIACYGDSAGAGTSLWLAVHDDLANPESEDPVLRESTRILAAGMVHGQFSYDITQWKAEFSKRFGERERLFESFDSASFYDLDNASFSGEEGEIRRSGVDMRSMLDSDDPPILMVSRMRDRQPFSIMDFAHHPLHAEILSERASEVGATLKTILPHVDPADTATLRQNPDIAFLFVLEAVLSPPAIEDESEDEGEGGTEPPTPILQAIPVVTEEAEGATTATNQE